VSIGIIVTGGVVRVSGSGLGCPSWPDCTADSLTPPAGFGLHGAIEFGNRMLTGVVCLAVAWVILAVRLQPRPDRRQLRFAWAQFWIVVLNAVVGGVTVLVGLNPYVVALHFLAALLLLTATTISWELARNPRADGRPAGRDRPLAVPVAMVLAVLVVVAGTVVTGTGPHPGDSGAVARMPFDWTVVVYLHGSIATLLLADVVACALLARRRSAGAAARRSLILVAVLLGQAGVGLVQSLIGLPAAAVILHMLGAAFVWVGAVRLQFADFTPGRQDAAPAVAGARAGVTASA
jgi:cytochrome c oxidase assembly protein subunit 15